MTRTLVLLCLILPCLMACNQQSALAPQQYLEWVEDPEHGLKTEKVIGEFKFALQYKPSDYIALKQMGAGVSDSTLKVLHQELEGLQQFNLTISIDESNQELLRSGIHSEAEYQQRIQYYSYAAQEDFKLIEGKDTLDCILYHFERSYELAPYSTIVLGFQRKKADSNPETGDKIISYNDRALGVGIVQVGIKSEDIKHIPKLLVP